MNLDGLFSIDVGAEVATLCDAQLQGPWQVPTEIVRLTIARGGARVEIDRRRGGFRFRCDGVLAIRDELLDLASVFDRGASAGRRQEAIFRVEGAGLSALMWAAGLSGARLTLRTRSGGRMVRMDARPGRIDLADDVVDPGPPSTSIQWRCRGLSRRRAVAWLRTALRFVPIPVTVCGKPVERGFREGLYRMRIANPLTGEIAVTASGEAPTLWLLEHGVLSARAVVPGYPAFSAAIEMSDVAPASSSADELRAAANPHLDRLIDEAGRMLILLVDRLPKVESGIRARLTTLLLRSAILGLRRDQIMASPMVGVRVGSGRQFLSPSELAEQAHRQGGVLHAVDPESSDPPTLGGTVLEATTEERSLLAELLDARIEVLGGGRRQLELGARIIAVFRRVSSAVRGLIGPEILHRSRLTVDENHLIDVAAAAGVDLALADGSGSARRRRSLRVLSRGRPDVRAAVQTVALDEDWLYPALLAVADEDLELVEDLRNRWLETMMAGRRHGSTNAGAER